MLKPWVSWWCLPRGVAPGSRLPQTAQPRTLHPHTHFREPICKKIRGWPEKNRPTGTKFPERPESRKLDFKSSLGKKDGKGFRSTLNAVTCKTNLLLYQNFKTVCGKDKFFSDNMRKLLCGNLGKSRIVKYHIRMNGLQGAWNAFRT